MLLTAKKSLTAQPLTVYYSSNGINGEKNALTDKKSLTAQPLTVCYSINSVNGENLFVNGFKNRASH